LLRSWWPFDAVRDARVPADRPFQQECEKRADVAITVFREDITILEFPRYEAAEARYQAASEHGVPGGDYRCISLMRRCPALRLHVFGGRSGSGLPRYLEGRAE
jgi:hypothetical protein